MDELLADFLSDAADSLEIVEADLLRLESRPGGLKGRDMEAEAQAGQAA